MHTPPSLIALAFHNGLKYRNADGTIGTERWRRCDAQLHVRQRACDYGRDDQPYISGLRRTLIGHSSLTSHGTVTAAVGVVVFADVVCDELDSAENKTRESCVARCGWAGERRRYVVVAWGRC